MTPNLNPIENNLALLKRRVETRVRATVLLLPKDSLVVQHLKKAMEGIIHAEWNKISKYELQQDMELILDRITGIIEVKSCHTRW